jgi:hypothetical protein
MAPRLYSLALTGDQLLGDARVFKDKSAADLTAFFLPSSLHPLWGETVTRFYLGIHPDAMLWNVSLGLVATALALVTFLPRRLATGQPPKGHELYELHEFGSIRANSCNSWPGSLWRWWLLLGAMLLLAMGEELRAFGVLTGVPLPYALLADLPGIRASHRPNHFALLAILLVALLAAFGLVRLFGRNAGRGMRDERRGKKPSLILHPSSRIPHPWIFAFAVITLAVLVDGLAWPLPLVARDLPPGYARLPAPDGGALLPVPINLNVSRSENLWYQTVHGWPIVGGFIGREPPYPLGRYAPGVRELRYGRAETDDILAPGWPEVAHDSLAHAGIRFVLLHPDAMKASYATVRPLVDQIGLVSSYADERLEIYPVPPVETPRLFGYLGAGWGGVEREGERSWRWMGARAELHLANPFDAPRPVRLDLLLESFERDRPLSIRLGEHGPPATLIATRARQARSLWLLLPPGTHVVYFDAPADPRPGKTGTPISISFARIRVR